MNLVHYSRRAMACEFEICVPETQSGEAAEAVLAALDLVQALERQMSVFRPESDVSTLNVTAAIGPVEVEPRLFALLELAMQVNRASAGAYDITAGPLWEAWGFARRAGAVPSADDIAAARSRVGADAVLLDAAAQTVRFLRPGVQLNLGSIGKGHAVDRCAELLLERGVTDFLVHGGGSSVRTQGSASGRTASESEGPQPQGWSVGVPDPLRPDRRVGEVLLLNRAIGTSGAQFQSFRHQGRRYGHILDPRTGWPAEGTMSVTVVASSAALADALSTACYVLGPAAIADFCRGWPDAAVLLFEPASSSAGWTLHRAGSIIDRWTLPTLPNDVIS